MAMSISFRLIERSLSYINLTYTSIGRAEYMLGVMSLVHICRHIIYYSMRLGDLWYKLVPLFHRHHTKTHQVQNPA